MIKDVKFTIYQYSVRKTIDGERWVRINGEWRRVRFVYKQGN
jgi:hypothetical protein